MPGPQPCAATRYCFAYPVSPHIVGRGLDPSVGRRGHRPLQGWPATIPTPMHARGGLRAGRPTISRSPHPVGAGHARPATSSPPAVNLPPPTPPTICAPHPPSPPYTPCPNFSLKLCRKNQKNLQKPVDKGHTTCYNNQAVSRAKPAAAAAGAFTYSLYAFFEENFFKKLSENLLTNERI